MPMQMPVQTMAVQMPTQSAQMPGLPGLPVYGGQAQAAPRPVTNPPAPMLASAEPRPAEPRPKVRLQAPDEPVQPPATRLTLPPPEQLEIGRASCRAGVCESVEAVTLNSAQQLTNNSTE